ncbi:hypothetical protein [Porphyrobacter sp. AAP60]|uniref:hypothetical protein n=1 Tax=Porphyrobacter sp. AAP60 TaxID=1523423 RepID=UPI0006CD2AAF|nr:hypothetical protein [Porphyrobacter sp. AAP60]KPF61794.1 hypothetical protein IP79_14615 [Porphyrobacter sp. AAP60]
MVESVPVERIATLLWREKLFALAEAAKIAENIGFMAKFGEQIPLVPAIGNQLLVGRYQTVLSHQLREALNDRRQKQERQLFRIDVLNGSMD